MKDTHQDSTTQIYNSNAEIYKSKTENFQYVNDSMEYFLDSLQGKKILDAGCAFGREVLRLRKKWYEAYGIDISSGLLELADESITAYLTEWDIVSLDTFFKHQSFHGIICNAAIVHMDKECGKEVIRHIYNLLQPGWYFFFSLKLKKPEQKEMELNESISIPWVVKKYVYYTQQEIESFLETIGFTLEKKYRVDQSEKDTWYTIICNKV